MQSIENKIYTKIKYSGKGKLFFSDNFVKYGTPDSITKALTTLCKKEILVRLARGVYLYPEFDEKLGLGMLIPSASTIAKAIAKRDKARIAPIGAYALNALGLSTQIVTNVVYLTDGTPRKIQLAKQKITFKHTAPKNLAYKSDIMMLVVSALKEIGSKDITEIELSKIIEVLSQEKRENILIDLNLAPAWIRKIILNLQQNELD
ncbi:MAG: DUF6088 family protein [Muribaculaceae bacterium]